MTALPVLLQKITPPVKLHKVGELVLVNGKAVYEKYDRNLTRTAEALKAARNTVKKYLED